MISDFHMPLAQLEGALSNLTRHHIVPVVLWDADEYTNLPENGILEELSSVVIRT
jgi:hypothetical protein